MTKPHPDKWSFIDYHMHILTYVLYDKKYERQVYDLLVNKDVHIDNRVNLLHAFIPLIVNNKLNRQEAVSCLRSILLTALQDTEEQDPLISLTIGAIADAKLYELKEDVLKIYAKDSSPRRHLLDRGEFLELLSQELDCKFKDSHSDYYTIDLEDDKLCLWLSFPPTVHKERMVAAMSDAMAAKESTKLHIVGRNAPCPCGSGKKYKKCCLN